MTKLGPVEGHLQKGQPVPNQHLYLELSVCALLVYLPYHRSVRRAACRARAASAKLPLNPGKPFPEVGQLS